MNKVKEDSNQPYLLRADLNLAYNMVSIKFLSFNLWSLERISPIQNLTNGQCTIEGE